MLTRNLQPTIDDMLAEIVLDIRARKVTSEEDHAYGAYYAAQLELQCSSNPDLRYVHNVLAAALNRPLATRH